jgi:hypothetical protein
MGTFAGSGLRWVGRETCTIRDPVDIGKSLFTGLYPALTSLTLSAVR